MNEEYQVQYQQGKYSKDKKTMIRIPEFELSKAVIVIACVGVLIFTVLNFRGMRKLETRVNAVQANQNAVINQLLVKKILTLKKNPPVAPVMPPLPAKADTRKKP